ncbi:MAG: 30S ribosomal protein S9 [Hadesarchaea archaeon]|nr:30S ribosomal protein S9 [Hadesarchaea archaeon]
MKIVQASGRHKAAIARATVRDGEGRVYVNGVALEAYQPEIARLRIQESLMLVPELTKKVDIHVRVSGGGFMGQANAARTAIARALADWSGSEEVREKFRGYDWSMIKSDVRRKEPKKPGGPGARAKYQKSYR